MCVAKLIHSLLMLLKLPCKYSTWLSDNPRIINKMPLHDSMACVVCAVSAKSITELIHFSVTVNSERRTIFEVQVVKVKECRFLQQDGADDYTASNTLFLGTESLVIVCTLLNVMWSTSGG